MKTGKYILIMVGLMTVLALSGCGNSCEKSAAQRRWDRAIEQARIDAANLSIQQGNLEYARVLLEEIAKSDSPFVDDAAVALNELKLVTEQFVQARLGQDPTAEISLLN